MSQIYAMRRANGDWFAVEHRGVLCVPVFHSAHDATMARLRNVGMQLFKPVALNAHLLKEMAPGQDNVGGNFCMVNDPFDRLSRSSPMKYGELALLVNGPGQTLRAA